jgi:hypothetical protein
MIKIHQSAAFLLVATLVSGCVKRVDQSKLTERDVNLVSESVIKSMAEVFNPNAYYKLNSAENRDPIKVSINGSNVVQNIVTINDDNGIPAIYVCNFEKNQGFLIASADYGLKPVLGFAEDGNFDLKAWSRNDKGIPGGFKIWMDKMLNRIKFVRANSKNLNNQSIFWKSYISRNTIQGAMMSGKELQVQNSINRELVPDNVPVNNPCATNPNYYRDSAIVVNPLVPYAWGQDETYNDDVPVDTCSESYGPHGLTGCVPTALSMVMAYWHPVTRYNFDFAIMPATSGDTAVSRLMYEVGANTATGYGCTATGTDPRNAGQGFVNTIDEVAWSSNPILSSYSSSDPDGIISDLKSGYPVCFSANDPNYGAHFWVVDGFEEEYIFYCLPNQAPSTGYFTAEDYELYWHMNWGFHSILCNPPTNRPDYNGWFDYTSWPISGAGPNGATLNFDQDEQVLSEIHPS